MRENLKKVAERISKMLSRTTENGCTEEEALTAAKLAHDEMEKYQLTMSDLELQREGCELQFTERGKIMGKTLNWKYGTKDKIAPAISRYCDVKVWRGPTDEKERKIYFFGLKSDAELAVWLMDSLTWFITVEADKYMGSHYFPEPPPRWHNRVSFINGVAARITQRLNELAAARELAKPKKLTTGKELIVVKNAMIAKELDKLELSFRKTTSGQQIKLPRKSFEAGVEAGDRASLARPVTGDTPRQLTH